ncbi:uncharacterized protein [Bombus flavifrons]|uniref:uncharacterized protein n=1 Tax=Bombus flavifrons TaxID=103934 RepID=UPI003703DAF1
MDTRSKKEIKTMITKDMSNIHNYCLDIEKFINDQLKDTLDYLHSLTAAIPQSVPGPSTTKTPKVLKKKGYHRKETIPENDIINIDNTATDSAVHDKTVNKDVKTGDVVETTIDRTKRKASIKAAINIKKQQSMSLVTKLRRLTLDDDSNRKRGSRPKKTKIADTVIAPTGNDIEELSMCKDALEKFTPLMNSTMDINSTYTQKYLTQL